jgi:hypothetical protein
VAVAVPLQPFLKPLSFPTNTNTNIAIATGSGSGGKEGGLTANDIDDGLYNFLSPSLLGVVSVPPDSDEHRDKQLQMEIDQSQNLVSDYSNESFYSFPQQQPFENSFSFPSTEQSSVESAGEVNVIISENSKNMNNIISTASLSNYSDPLLNSNIFVNHSHHSASLPNLAVHYNQPTQNIYSINKNSEKIDAYGNGQGLNSMYMSNNNNNLNYNDTNLTVKTSSCKLILPSSVRKLPDWYQKGKNISYLLQEAEGLDWLEDHSTVMSRCNSTVNCNAENSFYNPTEEKSYQLDDFFNQVNGLHDVLNGPRENK